MPAKVESTHEILPRQLIVYRRGQSGAWQCRYKCDGKWQRTSTKEVDLQKAIERSKRLLIEAEVRKAQNLPVVTRRFRDVANLAVERMEQELKSGKGKVSFKDYIRVITEYLIPILGKRLIASIDVAVLDELDAQRIALMGKEPARSTLLTHNSALNRVFDEAQMRGFITEANRPTLESKGKDSQRRAAFTLNEVQAMISVFDAWIDRARDEKSRESRIIMRDYVFMLLDTGARPGIELLELQWNKISENKIAPVLSKTGEFDAEHQEPVMSHNLQRSVMMTVSGKTGTRDIIGNERAITALRNIAQRNFPDVQQPGLSPLKNLAKPSNKSYVFRRKDGSDPSSSFQKMFENFLREHSLLEDPRTGQNRVFYSLRHTYATFALTHDKVPIHTLAKQMGTSVLMIEKHYSKLTATMAAEKLA